MRETIEARAKASSGAVKQISQLMLQVNDDVLEERERQNQKWGLQRHSYGDWLKVLGEEFGEVCQAMQVKKGWGKPSDAQDLYKELIHLSAVASAIAEQVREETGGSLC